MTSPAGAAVVGWDEIQDIELVIVRRMREHATGAHPSAFRGAGHEPAGLRDWQPGDRPSAIDWAQSTLTNFAPLVTREQEHESTARVVIVADTSLSTRCGAGDVPVATIIARTVATLALAGALFQDQVGLVTLDGRDRRLAVPPQVGKNHALHCLETYQAEVGTAGAEVRTTGHSAGGRAFGATRDAALSALLRRSSLVPVISDFLFADSAALLGELADLNARHDVFVVLIDAAYAFDLPVASAGWIEACDVETGRTAMLSAAEFRSLAGDVRAWQDRVAARAQESGIEVLRLGADAGSFHEMLVDFLADRRMRRR